MVPFFSTVWPETWKNSFFYDFCDLLHCPAEISQEPESFRACAFLRWKNVRKTTISKKMTKVILAVFERICHQSWKNSNFRDFLEFSALSGANISKTGICLDMRIFWGDRVSLELQILKIDSKSLVLLFEQFGLKLEKVLFFCDFLRFFALSGANISGTGIFLEMRFNWGDRMSSGLHFLKKWLKSS